MPLYPALQIRVNDLYPRTKMCGLSHSASYACNPSYADVANLQEKAAKALKSLQSVKHEIAQEH